MPAFLAALTSSNEISILSLWAGGTRQIVSHPVSFRILTILRSRPCLCSTILAPRDSSSETLAAEGSNVRPTTESILDTNGSDRRSSAMRKPVWPSTAVMQTFRDMALVKSGLVDTMCGIDKYGKSLLMLFRLQSRL